MTANRPLPTSRATRQPTSRPTGRPSSRRKLALATAGLAALGVLPATLAGTAGPASASYTGKHFYTPPSSLAKAAPGTIIRKRPLTLGGPGAAAPPNRAWSVMYHSRDAHGRDIAVTGTVVRPTSAWTGSGRRPWVSYAVGTLGLGHQCSPSRQFAAGTEYETPNIIAALDRGYGVAVTDYEGYVNGSTPTYIAGRSQAHTVLDAIRAARHIERTGVVQSTRVGLWGYSQGGGATGWAAALAPSYAGGLKIVGSASGGVPANLKVVGANLNGSVNGGLLGDSLVGLSEAYPKLANFDALSNRQGRTTAAQLKKECVNANLTNHPFLDVKNLTKRHLSYVRFSALRGEASILRRNNLGTAAPAPKVPVLQYHSSNDEIVPLGQAQKLHAIWCAKGVQTSMVLYPGEHLTGDTVGAPGALAFLGARFQGQPFVSSCPL